MQESFDALNLLTQINFKLIEVKDKIIIYNEITILFNLAPVLFCALYLMLLECYKLSMYMWWKRFFVRICLKLLKSLNNLYVLKL